MSKHDLTPLARVQGCLLGGAVGDALGAPVEFCSAQAIFRRYGLGGIRDYPQARGLITDDTQMTMATARGLLAAQAGIRGDEDTGAVIAVYQQYLLWLETQSDPEQQRAPGNTCLSALQSGQMGTLGDPINNSKGCGGVMRVAPVGLALPGRPDAAYALGCATAAITHGHPGGQTPSGWLAALIAKLVAGGRLADSVAELLALPLLDMDSAALAETACALAREQAPPTEAWRRLGQGWTGDEALALSLYAALSHPGDLETAVVTAVNHTGDSDSTGAICGAILGALLGVSAVPERWLIGLEHRMKLQALSSELVAAFW